MSQVLRLLLFLAVVAAGLALPWRGSAASLRRAQNAFIVLVLGLGALVGITGKDAWPFSPYPVLAEDARRGSTLERIEVKGIDESGREWDVHPLAWSPLPSTKIAHWIDSVHPSLGPTQERNAERFLLSRAERARQLAAAGHEPGDARGLGPLTAPHWLRLRTVATAPTPFVALRAYRVRWRPREVLADPNRRERRLIFDTGRP